MFAVKLRDYQTHYVQEILNKFENGIDRVLVVMPTGTGKTTVFSAITDHYTRTLDTKVLILVHRIELVEQIIDRLAGFGIQAGQIAGGAPGNLLLSVQVAMIQSLQNAVNFVPQYIIIDECHHSVAETYQQLWSLYPDAKILGVTATPIRTDGKGFGNQYKLLLNLYPLRWYFQRGYLVKPKHYVCSVVDPDEARLRNGEFDLVQMATKLRDEKKLAKVIDSYNLYTPKQQTLVFAPDLETSRIISERFQYSGIPAAHLDGNMLSHERKQIVQQFKDQKLNVIVNFDIVSEGFDVPTVQSVMLLRRTKSLSLFLQWVGRSLRPAEGKASSYVLDCANVWLDHGFAGTDYNWSLDGLNDHKNQLIESKLAVKDRRGKIVQVPGYEEIDGVELVSLSDELQRLVMFDKHLNDLLKKKDKVPIDEKCISAIIKYIHFLEFQGLTVTSIEREYCLKKCDSVGVQLPASIWRQIAA